MVGQQAKEDRALLLQTLRETARTQASMVGQLAKDLSQLYRSMDLRPQIIPLPLPPIVQAPVPPAAQPGAAPQAWMGPVQPVPMPPLASGLPRYAREEETGEEEQPATPEAYAAPEARAMQGGQGTQMAHAVSAPPPGLKDRLEARVAPILVSPAAAGQKAEGKGKVGESIRQALKDYLAQVRDRLEGKTGAAPAAQIANAAPEAHAVQGAPEAHAVQGAQRAPGARKAPAASPGSAPAEPSAAPGAHAAQIAHAPQGAQIAHAPQGAQIAHATQGTQAEAVEPLPPSEAKPGEPAEVPEGPLNFLEELAEYLPKRNPERRKNAFLRSDARMKLEYLKARIERRPGLKARIEGELAPEGIREEGPVSLQKIADAFTFMHDLAGYHPDRTLGTMLQSKLNGILRQIKE